MNIFIAIEIENPRAPITRSPIAETFEIVLNSDMVGFFKSRQTRRYLLYLVASVLVSLVMLIRDCLGF